MFFYAAFAVAVCSGLALAILFAADHTMRVPTVGGTYTEAMLGSPRFINPILAPANDADRDLVKLVYSGLMRYDNDGALVPDLAESYTVSTDSRVFTFQLKTGVTWHDGAELTVDDVAFTVRLLQSADYQSPLRFAWQGVRVEKTGDRIIAFTLASPYTPFLGLTTVGIMPRHVWQDVLPQAFAISDFNLQPVGSGPFKFHSMERDRGGIITAMTLQRNEQFYRHSPYLEEVVLRFYETREDAQTAVTEGVAEGIAGDFAITLPEYEDRKLRRSHTLQLPRIFAIFFNQIQSTILAQKAVREALDYATDRVTLIQKAYDGVAEELYGPLPSSVLGYSLEIVRRNYDPQKAASLLEQSGWRLQEDGARVFTERKKTEQAVDGKKTTVETTVTTTLEFSLLTANVTELEQIAALIKSQWEAVGVRVNIEIAGVADIQGERVRPRLFDAVLFGQVYGLDPDPYAFWHSSQRRDPGLNLAQYANPKVDRIMEEIRQAPDAAIRVARLGELQKAITEDIPAIFLASPQYNYHLPTKILNMHTRVIANPSERFGGVTEWYMKTKRVWR